MEQLTQKLKNGEMQLMEVPYPMLTAGAVLVRNHYSLISAGTEGKTVKDARMGFIAKARSRKDELKKVIETARTYGIYNTYKMVMNRLDAPSALGYSCAGEIIAVADDVTEFTVGDLVACGGSTAVHAEVVAVPVKLCVKVREGIPMKHAAFTTVGAIALQGVRQADLKIGESCMVIGLGLVGQLTVQLLKASGVNVIGVDINNDQVELAAKTSHIAAYNRSREDLEQIIYNATNGFGADCVIITAASSSNDPVDLAGAVCRKKGRVIIVGAVPTGFSRKNYYLKELDLRMSGSYGPGRYDFDYEQKGLDYPYAFVRWTENRNMQAFIDLLSSGRIFLSGLVTHIFDFKDAPDAYDLILNKAESFSGILLQYDTSSALKPGVVISNKAAKEGDVNAGLIGAGSFAQNILLPALKGHAEFIGIATSSPNNSKNIAEKYGFGYCTSDTDELLKDKKINTLFIATRHNSHAEYIIKGLKHGKNVFCEKPMCITLDELESIRQAYIAGESALMVGFNRRFSPHAQYIKKNIAAGSPVAINYRVNAGQVPADHWIHDKTIGGGRVIGEVCHFIDLCSYLAGSTVKHISALHMRQPHDKNDTLNIQLKFDNGNIASISYFSNGSKNLHKENIEVFANGRCFVSEDFSRLYIYGNSRKLVSSGRQDKGHKNEIAAFTDAIKKGLPSPVDFNDLYNTTLATLKVHESIALNGSAVEI